MAITVWPADPVAGSPSYSAIKDRQTHSVLLGGASPARPLGARSGIRCGSGTVVSLSGGSWSVQPHAGCMDVAGATNGPYLYANDAATIPSAITAAHATWPRVDVVYARLDDPGNGDGTSNPLVAFGYVAGTAAASNPAPPTSWTGSSRSMVIGYINVPAATGGGASSATFTPVAPILDLHIFPVRSQAERDAITIGTAENPVWVDRLDLGILERSVASGVWTPATIGPWVAYTPTVSGVVLGAGGGAAAVWRYEGNLIRVRPVLTWGTGASGAQPRITLPVASLPPSAGFQVLGTATLRTGGGAAVYAGAFTHVSTSLAQINYLGANGLLADVNLAAPAAPNAGDTMSGEFTYRWA